jgi:hypothetical protein
MQPIITVRIQGPTVVREEREDTTVLTMTPRMQLMTTASDLDHEDRLSSKDINLTKSIRQ